MGADDDVELSQWCIVIKQVVLTEADGAAQLFTRLPLAGFELVEMAEQYGAVFWLLFSPAWSKHMTKFEDFQLFLDF